MYGLLLVSTRHSESKQLSFARLLCGAFALCLVLGGAGEDYPFIALVPQLVCVGLLVSLPADMVAAMAARDLRPKLVLLALTLAVPLLQLIPLPPGIWTALPGRGLVAEVLRAAELPLGWRPLTVDPALTRASLYEAIPILVFFVIGLACSNRVHRELILVMVAAAIVAALLGTLQRGFGPGSVVDLYPSAHSARSPGLFVNRNHQACFLLATMPMIGALARDVSTRRRVEPAVRATVVVASLLLLTAAILATASRSGALLLGPVLLATIWLMIGFDRRVLLGVIGLMVTAFIGVMAFRVDALEIVMTRFATVEDDRLAFWTTTLEAIRAFWPAGSGLGTFPQVYALYERIGDVTPTYPYNAHNEYLQLMLELGLPGVALILAWTASLTLAAKHIMTNRAGGGLTKAAMVSLAVILAHSLVDYPGRSISLGAVAGLLFGMLFNICAIHQGRESGSRRTERTPSATGCGRSRIVVSFALIPPVGLLIWSMTVDARIAAGLSQSSAQPLAAYSNHSAPVANALAQEAFAQDRMDEAQTYAASAIARSPLDSQGLTERTLVAQASNDPERARRLVHALSQMGWRQPVTQYVLAFDAAEREDLTAAVSHADAVLRQGMHKRELFPFLRQVAKYADGRKALTTSLARSPDWREDFLRGLSGINGADTGGHFLLLRDLARTSAPPTVDEYDGFIQWLIRRKNYGSARKALDLALAGRVPASADKMLLAGTFGFDNELVWQFDNDVGVDLKKSSNGVTLIADEPFQGRLMRLLVTAAAGDQTLVLDAEGAAAALDELTWTVRCAQTQQRLAIQRQSMDGTGGRYRARYHFVVPTNCSEQLLELHLDHPAGTRVEMLIRRAAIG